MEKLFRDNRGLIWYWVQRYATFCAACAAVDTDDLVQVGFLALIEARRTYDPQQGAWSNWASLHIRRFIRDALGLARNTYTVTLNDGSREKRRFFVGSLDAPAYDEDDPTTLMETLTDESAPQSDEFIISDETARIVREAVAGLDSADMREAVKEHFLNGRTYQAIAEDQGCAPSMIRNRCNNGLRRLRQDYSIRQLIDLETRYIAHKGVTAFLSSQTSVVEDAVLWREQRLSHRRNA